MPNKKKQNQTRVNPNLEGFDISVDKFGEINSSIDIDKVNKFLNRNVEDKKLKDRQDLEELKK